MLTKVFSITAASSSSSSIISNFLSSLSFTIFPLLGLNLGLGTGVALHGNGTGVAVFCFGTLSSRPFVRYTFLCHFDSCADPGIFRQGGPGQSDKIALTTFFFFFSAQLTEGVQHYPGRVQLLIPYRNLYNL